MKPVAGTSSSTASTSAADGTVIDTAALPRLVDPHDITADLNHRGRSYLHVNCAHCHREHGGGSARIHVAIENPLRETEALRARPTQGTFGIFDAEIIAPGDPYRSVMYFRMAKAGPGHMPHLGATIIDDRGVELIHDWIQSLPLRAELADLLQQLTQSGGSTLEASTQEALIGQLLSTPPGGMLLARAVRQHELPADVVELAVKLSREHESLAVRDLFEPFLPDDQKPKRLGDVINPASLLAVVGNAERGRALFANGAGIQCRNCHRVGETGVELGPDLTHIGKKLDRVKLLESMLEPSRTIDPKYIMWLVETKQGMVVSGLLVEKNDKEVVLKDSKRQLLRLPVSDVEGMYPQQKSLMPELLLRDMSAEQVADLLTWLESLR